MRGNSASSSQGFLLLRNLSVLGGGNTYERTNRSRFSHLGFLGLNLMNRSQRTWATGAMPLQIVVVSNQLSTAGVAEAARHRKRGQNSHGGTGMARVALEGGIDLEFESPSVN